MKYKQAIKRVIFSVCILGAVILALGSLPQVSAVGDKKYAELQNFAKILNLIQQYYVEEVDAKKLIYGGIKGMLRELDPHTSFLAPKVFKEFESETSGEFGGLGIEISLQKGILTIISPIDDTPAFKAGLKPGDKVVNIDGTSTKGMSLVEAAQFMRGKRGTKVNLGILRKGEKKVLNFVIKRETIKISSVKYTDIEDGYMYIRVTSFIENTYGDLLKAIKKHKKKNKKVHGMIIDLRRNPGGLFDQAVKMSDLFLEKGIIVSTMGRNKKEREIIHAKKSNSQTEYPIIVLINEYSASASEILAGALQDNKRALVMGRRSFGKGSVQSVVKLGDGSGLKMTVARYYTPSGRSIQAKGIDPDVILDEINTETLKKAIIKDVVTREKDIIGHLENEKGEKDKNKKESHSLFYWVNKEMKNKNSLSPKEKLLKNDFEIIQAYNYLRAWKKLRVTN